MDVSEDAVTKVCGRRQIVDITVRVLAVLLALALLPGWLAGSASAQDAPAGSSSAPEFSTMDISLWPEHDRPEMLVIYRGLVSGGSNLPAQIDFRIPSAAGQPSAVAYFGEDGGRYNQDYTTHVDGEWIVVSFQLAASGFQVEYYAPLGLSLIHISEPTRL